MNLHTAVGGGEGGQHLVHVHVGRGAGPCLVGVDGEMVVVSSTDDLLRPSHDRLGDGGIDDAKLLVDDCCCALDVSQRHNLSGL